MNWSSRRAPVGAGKGEARVCVNQRIQEISLHAVQRRKTRGPREPASDSCVILRGLVCGCSCHVCGAAVSRCLASVQRPAACGLTGRRRVFEREGYARRRATVFAHSSREQHTRKSREVPTSWNFKKTPKIFFFAISQFIFNAGCVAVDS